MCKIYENSTVKNRLRQREQIGKQMRRYQSKIKKTPSNQLVVRIHRYNYMISMILVILLLYRIIECSIGAYILCSAVN